MADKFHEVLTSTILRARFDHCRVMKSGCLVDKVSYRYCKDWIDMTIAER